MILFSYPKINSILWKNCWTLNLKWTWRVFSCVVIFLINPWNRIYWFCFPATHWIHLNHLGLGTHFRSNRNNWITSHWGLVKWILWFILLILYYSVVTENPINFFFSFPSARMSDQNIIHQFFKESPQLSFYFFLKKMSV